MANVLVVGESWVTHSIHQKGFDSFCTTEYVEGAGRFLEGLARSGHHVDYVPAHDIARRVPSDVHGLNVYGAVVISDVGANSFLLAPETFKASQVAPNRLSALGEYVRAGGGLLMVGGYLSFSGISGLARYGRSPLAEVLPVTLLDVDDRVEAPEGVTPEVVSRHETIAGLPAAWPTLLGYNALKAKPGATTVVTCNSDPLLVVGLHGAGRTAAFASDLAPHWAPPGFLEWKHYDQLWDGLVRWLAGGDVPGRRQA